jgi:pSer/pThr/pTyr-binding forkhead associated (FHA) protein
VNGDRRWPLFPGDNTIGRDASSDVFLDIPVIQAKRLVSGQHARIYVDRDQHILYDGSLTGKPSANGTYVNSQRIPDYGLPLQNGDIIILGALHPQHPSVDTPGVAVLRFQQNTSME